MVGAFKENPLRHISSALEVGEDLSERPEFATLEQQFEHRPQLQKIFREIFATNSTDHWVARLEGEDILCAPVRSLEEALADEQTAVSGMVIELEHPTAGPYRSLDVPIRLSATPRTIRHVPPRIGEHNAAVLLEHGYEQAEIEKLTEAGVLR
jgi:formyl-CoA transferase